MAACTDDPPGRDTAKAAGPTTAADYQHEAEVDQTAVLSPLAFQALAPVVPVVGTDGRRHYAYELTVVNQSPGTAKLMSLQAQTPDGANVGNQLNAAMLGQLVRVNGSKADDATLYVTTDNGSGRDEVLRISIRP